jgi:hypothetical protein
MTFYIFLASILREFDKKTNIAAVHWNPNWNPRQI